MSSSIFMLVIGLLAGPLSTSFSSYRAKIFYAYIWNENSVNSASFYTDDL